MRTIHFVQKDKTGVLCGAEGSDLHASYDPEKVTCEHCLRLMEADDSQQGAAHAEAEPEVVGEAEPVAED